MSLSTLVVVTNADLAFRGETVGPETTNVDISFGHAHVSEEQPGSKYGLGEDVENRVSDDLLIHVHVAASISHTPNARQHISGGFLGYCGWGACQNLHGVDGPDDESEATNGSKEVADFATFGQGCLAAVED